MQGQLESPFDRAHRVYLEHPQQETFSQYLIWHYRNGFVFCTPDFFIMGRPQVKATLEDIGPTFTNERHPDTWFLHCMSGDMRKVWSIMPYYLPYIAFQRNRNGKLDLSIYLTERLRNATDTLFPA